MRTAVGATLIAALLSLSSGTALAQDTPSGRGYDETGGVAGVVGEIDTAAPSQSDEAPSAAPSQPAEARATTPQPVAEEGELPFTGLDLAIVAAMGIALLGTGLVLRRTSNRGPTS
jgi:Alphavirus glycoprotein J